jgi:hypothetical protein
MVYRVLQGSLAQGLRSHELSPALSSTSKKLFAQVQVCAQEEREHSKLHLLPKPVRQGSSALVHSLMERMQVVPSAEGW